MAETEHSSVPLLKRGSLRAALAAFLFFAVAPVAFAASYHGNTESRIVHQSSCRYFNCANCTAEFSSLSEAVKSGYRPCRVCRPGGSWSSAADVASVYSGNTSSRRFHRASCRYAGCRNCSAKFASRDEAIRAGYTPGACCRP